MKELLAAAAYIAFWITAVVAWTSAIISDATNGKIAWVIVDILVAPIGAIRGFILWFS